jgi:sugar lactone lactonase YvrE
VAPAGGTPQRVSVGAFSQAPAGLAFAADGSLYLGLRAGGGIWRLLLDVTGTERGRERFGSAAVWANGLAFDRAGRLHVATYSEQTAGPVLRFQPDGTGPVEVLTGGRFASLAFGRGRLDCFDLYATEPFGRFHRVRVDVPGLPLP